MYLSFTNSRVFVEFDKKNFFYNFSTMYVKDVVERE